MFLICSPRRAVQSRTIRLEESRLKWPGIGRTLGQEKSYAECCIQIKQRAHPSRAPGGRVTAEQKSLIERAAALQGRTLTDFVLTSVQDAARRAIEEHHQLTLLVRDSEAFIDALLTPRPVNDRLRDTVGRYRERAGV